MACLVFAVAGCGSSSDSPAAKPDEKPQPAVADRAVQGDRFFGFPAISEPAVRTDPGELSADLPGFYADPETAVADLRREGFVAGIGRTFKSEQGPDVVSAAVVQMSETDGATTEFDRELDGLLHPPCPPGLKCELETERFDVPGVPGAAGINTTQTIKNQSSSLHPDVLRADAVLFRDGVFVEQIFLGTERPTEHRAALIKAAQALYEKGA